MAFLTSVAPALQSQNIIHTTFMTWNFIKDSFIASYLNLKYFSIVKPVGEQVLTANLAVYAAILLNCGTIDRWANTILNLLYYISQLL